MPTDYKDYYKILGLEKGSDAKEIKKAYRKMARQYHPDVNPTNQAASDKFREISEAYEVLGDDEKRSIYDKYGEHYKDYEQWKKAGAEATGISFDDYIRGVSRQSPGGAPAPGSYPYRTVSPDDMGDLFGDDSPYSDFFYSIFNNGNAAGSNRQPRTRGPVKGRDLEYSVQVSLEEAYSGVKRVLEMEGEPGSGKATRRLEVSIPAGIQNGGRVRLAGLGSPGQGEGAPAGDLYLVVEVLAHVFFERKGADLFAKINVPLTTMLLGGEATVPTLKGSRLALKVPAGSATGSQIKLRGQGMPVSGKPTERGDLFVTLSVLLPSDLTAEEKAALEQFATLVQKRQQESSPKGGVSQYER